MRANLLSGYFTFRRICIAAVVSAIIGVGAVAAGADWHFDGQSHPAVTTVNQLPSDDGTATPIAYMKRLPDGASVYIHQKTVVGSSNGCLFLEEADRSQGIRVDVQSFYPPNNLQLGNTVSFSGVMGTVDGERVIEATSDFDYDDSSTATITPVGMSSAAILGWPKNFKVSDGPRVMGLLPFGTLVKVWGKVTARELADDTGRWYAYLDDGWNKRDGTDSLIRGLRVYSDSIPDPSQTYMTAVGVLTSLTYDPTPTGPTGDEFVIPVIRTSTLDDMRPPSDEVSTHNCLPIKGRVRLDDASTLGANVRIYSEHSSIVIKNVTSSWSSFELAQFSTDGAKISASAPGYISCTRDALGGDGNVELVLTRSPSYIELSCSVTSLRVCSNESASIRLLLRDCEGKGIPNRPIKISTSAGVLGDLGQKSLMLTSNSDGSIETTLRPGMDGAGVASVRAEVSGEADSATQTSIQFTGPSVTVLANPRYVVKSGVSLISANISDGTSVIPNAPITFRTDRGIFVESGTNTCSAYSDADGNASVTLSVTTQGVAKVLASYSNDCGQQTIGWDTVAYMSNPWVAKGVQYSNPMVADLNGNPDGRKELCVMTSDGDLLALDCNGSIIWQYHMHPPGSNTPSCAVIDADRSGLPCVFVPSESQQKAYAFTHDGKVLSGWPVASNYRFIKVGLVIADANLDGSPEILGGDECCYVFSWNPTGDWRATGIPDNSFLWRNLTGTPSTAIYGSTCAVGDLDGDSDKVPDIIVGTNRTPEVYAFRGDVRGDYISDPLYLDGWPKATGNRVESSPAIGDIDGDGRNDVVMGCDDGNVYMWLSTSKNVATFHTGGMIKSSPALCDLDGDGKLDVIVGSDTGRVYAINWEAQALPGWAGGILLNQSGAYPVESSPVIGDVTGDGQVNVVVGCDDGNVYAIYKDGNNHVEDGALTGPLAWVNCCIPPSQTSAEVTATPVIDDVDNDGKVDVVAASDQGIYIFHLNVPYVNDPALYPWPTFHRDNQRTGCVTPPPAPIRASIVGIVRKGGQPLPSTKVYVYKNDESGNSVLVHDYVLSVGASAADAGAGAYSINDLDPDQTYRLRVVPPLGTETWIDDIAVTTGAHQLDISL